ncbi:MAG: rhodanese-like domain-containing protein [Anaerolineae bacterium]|nr:rhodanese-like domain-containing protein [Anaerolineae bacterium]
MFKSFFNRDNQTQIQSKVKHINAAQLNALLDTDEEFVLVDVRSPMEYQYEGHVRGARLLPLQALSGRTDELPKNKTIVCICRSGNRSYFACEQLTSAGFEDVVNVSDGMIGWKMAGYPVQ